MIKKLTTQEITVCHGGVTMPVDSNVDYKSDVFNVKALEYWGGDETTIKYNDGSSIEVSCETAHELLKIPVCHGRKNK